MARRAGIAPDAWRSGLLVAAVAIAARLAVLAATGDYRPIHDDASYARTALWLLNTGHYPFHRLPGGLLQQSAYRPPGWPYLLAAIWSVTGVGVAVARAALVVLGVGGAVLVFAVGRELLTPAEARVAGLLCAVCPPLLAVGASLESETLFVTLVLAAILAALYARRGGPRWTALAWTTAAGLLIGLAALTRTNGIALVPVVAWLAIPGNARMGRALRSAGLVAVCAVLAIAPWTIRNADLLHRFVPVSTETGNTLAGTYNAASLRLDGRWLEPRQTGVYRAIYRRFGSGAAADPALLAAVGGWVARHPTYPLEVAWFNSQRLSGLAGPEWMATSLETMSLNDDLSVLVWLGLLAFCGLGLAGVTFARRRAIPAPVWVAPGVLFATAALVNGEVRLGAPVLPFLALLAALPVARGLRAIPGRHREEASGGAVAAHRPAAAAP